MGMIFYELRYVVMRITRLIATIILEACVVASVVLLPGAFFVFVLGLIGMDLMVFLKARCIRF